MNALLKLTSVLLFAAVDVCSASPFHSPKYVPLKPRASSNSTSNATSLIWPSQIYQTQNFSAPDMTITRSGSTENGYLFLEPAGSGTSSQAPLIMTDTNELVWHGPEGVGFFDYQNFRVQKLHGIDYLTYWGGLASATFTHGYGAVNILDSSYNQAYTICMSAAQLDIVTPNNTVYDCYLDFHESFVTDKGTLIATAYNVTAYDLTPVGGLADGYLLNSIFFEIDLETQEILFKWSALDNAPSQFPITDSHYPLTLPGTNTTFGLAQTNPWDYFHINSIQALDDGYLVNSRHFFSIFKVNKTGDIEWVLNGENGGDFTLDPDIYFSWEHEPRVSNYSPSGSGFYVHMFNNDNSEAQNGTNSTTGLLLSVDLTTRHVSLLRRLIDTSDLIFTASQGSYQPLANNHVLIGYGQNAVIREFNSAGTNIYQARFGYSTATSSVASYRTFRYTWHGQPSTPPVAVATNTNATTTVYMSWNGATDYDHWVILAGQNAGQLSQVARVKRSGFETEHTLGRAYGFVQVEAEGGKSVLGTSVVLSVG